MCPSRDKNHSGENNQMSKFRWSPLTDLLLLKKKFWAQVICLKLVSPSFWYSDKIIEGVWVARLTAGLFSSACCWGTEGSPSLQSHWSLSERQLDGSKCVMIHTTYSHNPEKSLYCPSSFIFPIHTWWLGNVSSSYSGCHNCTKLRNHYAFI